MSFYIDGCLNLAHRGALRDAPENTLAAFWRALELGADGVELDVTLSADGKIVVIHDDTVDRTTGGRGLVSELTLAELKRLDAGSWFAPEFADARIPTLDEVLQALPAPARINIELKSGLYSPIRDLSARVWSCVKRHNAQSRVLFSSFNPLVLWQAWLAGIPMRHLALLRSDTPPLMNRVGQLGELITPYTAIHPWQHMLTAATQARYTQRKLRVNTWFADSDHETEADIQRLLDLGVDCIINNRPDLVQQVLNRRSAVKEPMF